MSSKASPGCVVGFIVFVIAVAGIFAIQNRYVVTNTGKGVVYKTDRWTGKTTRVIGTREEPVKQVKPRPTMTADEVDRVAAYRKAIQPRPISGAYADISCQGEMLLSAFSGSMFNQSTYTIDSVVVRIEVSARSRWAKKYESRVWKQVLSADFSQSFASGADHNTSRDLFVRTGANVPSGSEARATCRVVSAMGHRPQ